MQKFKRVKSVCITIIFVDDMGTAATWLSHSPTSLGKC